MRQINWDLRQVKWDGTADLAGLDANGYRPLRRPSTG
jgi:hypothetical protein